MPFVEILPANRSPKETQWTMISLFLATVPLSLPLIKFVGKTFGIEHTRWTNVVGGLVFGLFVFMLFKLFGGNSAKVDELAQLTSLSSSVRKHPILILRAVDDEASLSLAAAAIANRLTARIGRWSYKFFLVLMILMGLIGLPLLFLFFMAEIVQFEPMIALGKKFEDNFEKVLEYRKGFALWGPLWGIYGSTLVFIMSLLFAPGAFKSFYGRELLFNSQGCQINSQSNPDSIDRQSDVHFGSQSIRSSWGTVVTLHQAEGVRRGLRHGLYADPQCAELIAGWLQSELAFRGA